MNGTLSMARTMYLQGRFLEAENAYQEALGCRPDDVEALEGLGALAYQSGRVEMAASMFARVTTIRPDTAVYHENLAETLRLLKRYDEADDHVKTALELNPSRPEGWNISGLIAFNQERYCTAESSFREAIRLKPGYADALVNLGSTLQALGKLADAAGMLRKALRFQPDHVAALTNLGQFLVNIGDPNFLDEAETLCRRAVNLAPRLPQALNGLGNVLRRQNRLEEAMQWYQRALQAEPSWSKTRHNIGHLLRDSGQYEDAARAFEDALTIDADLARYHANFGHLAADRKDHVKAAEHFRLALVHDECLTEAHHGLGLALLEQGRLDEAEACFREALVRINANPEGTLLAIARLQSERGEFELANHTARDALKLQPNLAGAFCQLALNLKDRMPDADLHRLEELRNQKYLPNNIRGPVHFSLAGIYDAKGLHARAAELLHTANALQASARATRGDVYDPDEYSVLVDRIIDSFTPEFIARTRGLGDPDRRPTFVVGFPRSGTTLVEQILASHPEVHGAGELPDLQVLFQTLPELVGQPAWDPFVSLNSLNEEIATAFAHRYLHRLESLASSSSRVVDKMPENFHLLGLIASVLTGAKVIVCTRDIRDVAVSCWQAGFATIPWANQFEHIARRLVDHERLLEHWRRVGPVSWLEVRYEELVGDVAGHSRQLINFLGLDWDPACLEFHSTRRVVRTASMVQVRQPAHSRSVGRWKHYEESLHPLFQAIDRLSLLASRKVPRNNCPGPVLNRGAMA